MPIFLEFKPKKIIVKSNFQNIAHDILEAFSNIPSLANSNVSVSIRDKNNLAELFKIQIDGISVIDVESVNMLASIVKERIEDSNLPIYLSQTTLTGAALPGEALFLHQRLKPIRSKHARLLSKIEEVQIPEEFCCPLSGDIMDDPVYDTRSPSIHYDQDFLQYWLRKNHVKLMPHTKMPANQNHIKVNFDLKCRIVNFVKSTIEAYEAQKKRIILEKFNIKLTTDKKAINQALRRAIVFEDTYDDFFVLLSLGADVNAQDDNPTKRFTPLHLAIRENKTSFAMTLLQAGARIDVADAAGITVSQLIIQRLRSNDPEIQEILHNCDILGLKIPGVVKNPPPAIPTVVNQAALFSPPQQNRQPTAQEQIEAAMRRMA